MKILDNSLPTVSTALRASQTPVSTQYHTLLVYPGLSPRNRSIARHGSRTKERRLTSALLLQIRMITLVLGGEGYLNFMGNEFGHPGETSPCLKLLNCYKFTDPDIPAHATVG